MSKKVFLKFISIILSLVLVVSSSGFTYAEALTTTSEKYLIVKYFNVGQGDCILVYMPNGETMLIDAGFDGNSNLLNPMQHLEAEQINEIDYFVTTHPDKDHIWYAEDIILNHYITSETIIMPQKENTSNMYQSLINTINDMDYLQYDPYLRQGDDGKLIPDAIITDRENDFKVELLGPIRTYSSNNNNSIVVKMTYKNNSFLFMGDAETSAEKDMLANYNDDVLKCDVLKCGHHGSDTSSSISFLEMVLPKYAVISCGADNKYGHPCAETVTNLQNMGTEMYRTDEIGTITATSNGSAISFGDNVPSSPDSGSGTKYRGNFLKWEINSNANLIGNSVIPSYQYYPNNTNNVPIENFITRDNNTNVEVTYLSSLNGYSIRSKEWLRTTTKQKKFWLFKISTIGYYDICMSALGKVTDAGPKYFDVEYSLNGINWTKLTDFYFESAPSRLKSILFNDECDLSTAFYLPDKLENKQEVFIRFLLTSDERCNSDTYATIYERSYFDLNSVKLFGSSIPYQCTVRFTDIDGNVCEKCRITLGKYAHECSHPNIASGEFTRYFLGWYTYDAALTNDISFNFNETPITGDMTFYPLYSGDTDGNGKLNLNDVCIILNHLTNAKKVTSIKQTYACDIDLETELDLLDENEVAPTEINLLDAYLLYNNYIV